MSNVNTDNIMKIGVKDVLARQVVSALELIEHEHMLIANQRGQITTHLTKLNSTKDDEIRHLGTELYHLRQS